MPDLGRWLDRDATAEYISVRVTDLPRLLKAGRLPKPSYHLGPKSPRWDRAALDSLFETGIPSLSVEAAVPAVVEDILRRGREKQARRQAQAGRRNGQAVRL